MISTFHLLWLVPTAFIAGYIAAAFAFIGGDDDE